MNTATIGFNCPWCGLLHLELVNVGAETQMVCGGGIGDMIFKQSDKGCKKPIRLITDNHGDLKLVARIYEPEKTTTAFQSTVSQGDSQSNNASINIGTVYGPVAFGGDATNSINIFNETVKAIDQAKNVEPEKKKQAKGALAYFKEYAPTALPIAADLIKKTLGL